LRERIPPSLLKAMEKMKDELAGSIVKLRQKYPLIYKRFQDRWDKLGARTEQTEQTEQLSLW